MDETHEIGFVNSGVCFDKSGKNNTNGRNSSQEKRLEVSKSCGELSSRISHLTKLFRCKFLKSRAFTLIEIMVVVSVLGVLGMGLRNTVKKVMHDYEVYSAVNFCKKIDSALKNYYLINNTKLDSSAVWFFSALSFISLAENDLKNFLPNYLVAKAFDWTFLKYYSIQEGIDFTEEDLASAESTFNGFSFPLTVPKCIKLAYVDGMTLTIVLNEKLINDFLKYYPNAVFVEVYDQEDLAQLKNCGIDLYECKGLEIEFHTAL